MNAESTGRAGFNGFGRMGAGMTACFVRAQRSLALLGQRNHTPPEPLPAIGAT